MKLRNKKTGEIVELGGLCCLNERIYAQFNDERGTFKFEVHSLAELNEEWEDYEEPNYHYCLDGEGKIIECRLPDEDYENEKAIGNYFLSIEEAEKAVEKLKAWKRLKYRGFRFDGYNACSVDYDIDEQYRKYISDDLELLFGGEE